MRVARVAPSRRPARKYRKASRGFPGEKPLPWCRSAATAINRSRLPIAKADIRPEVAGPSPVLAQIRQSETCAVTNACAASPFPIRRCGEEKRQDVTWFTESQRRLGLNVRNDPENLPTIARSEPRHRHRLCLDRSRRRRSPDRADLSRSDLTGQRTAGLAATGYPSSAFAPHRRDFPMRTVGIGHKARCRAFSPPARSALSLPNPRIPITTKSEA